MNNNSTNNQLAVIAVLAAKAVLGALVVTVAVTIPLQQAEAKGARLLALVPMLQRHDAYADRRRKIKNTDIDMSLFAAAAKVYIYKAVISFLLPYLLFSKFFSFA